MYDSLPQWQTQCMLHECLPPQVSDGNATTYIQKGLVFCLYLVIGEDSESVDFCLNGKAWACCITARHHPSNKSAMPQTILQCGLMRPVGPLPAMAA